MFISRSRHFHATGTRASYYNDTKAKLLRTIHANVRFSSSRSSLSSFPLRLRPAFHGALQSVQLLVQHLKSLRD